MWTFQWLAVDPWEIHCWNCVCWFNIIQSTFIVKNSPAGYWNIQHSFTILTDVNFTEKASMFTIFCTIPRCDRHVSSFTSKYTTLISRFAVFLFCCCYIFVHDFRMDGRSQTCFNCATFLICTSGVKSCNPVLVVGCCLLSLFSVNHL